MSGETVIKRSPIVFIRTFILIETAAFIAYTLALGGGSAKYDFYNTLFFSSVIPYSAAKILLLSGIQLLITIYAFLRWYAEKFIVSGEKIYHIRGVLFRKRSELPLDEKTSLSSRSGRLGKLLNYGSVRIQSYGKTMILPSIPAPEGNMRTVAVAANSSGHDWTAKPDVKEMLRSGEHEKLEFKSSLRFDRRTGQFNREIEKAAMKSISAFLNSAGGHLILGVSDRGGILGLQEDYQTLQRKDSDGFENHFTQVMNSMIGPEFRRFVRLWFHSEDGKDICVVSVAPGTRPAYLRLDNSEHFFIRTGNITTALKLSETAAYAASRWPEKNWLA